jgi:hypothetical protein
MQPQKPQEALNLLVTEERYWALFYTPVYVRVLVLLEHHTRSHVLHCNKQFLCKTHTGHPSTQAFATDYALTYFTYLELQLVAWPIVGLTTARFKPLIQPQKTTRGLEPVGYRGALLSTLLHAIVCVLYTRNLLFVVVQTANYKKHT